LIVKEMDEDELRAVLAAQAKRVPSALKSLRQYLILVARTLLSPLSKASLTSFVKMMTYAQPIMALLLCKDDMNIGHQSSKN
jgi:hypothetical protein